MKVCCFTLIWICSITSALAFDWKMQTGDVMLSGTALDTLVSGKKFKVGRAGWTEFRADGTYLWKGKDEGRKWAINPQGALCVDHPSGSRRCDIIVENASSHYLITYLGKRHRLEQQ